MSARQVLVLFGICSALFSDLEASQISYPEPARCNSDKDCLAKQAKCIRRECHCVKKFAFGDGKTKCEQWAECPFKTDPCKAAGRKQSKNSHCVRKPETQTVACRCDSGYFGRPQKPSCMKDKGAGDHSCLTDKNCPHYSKCVKNKCTCRFELTGDGETCKAAPPMSCSKSDDCHADKGKCVARMCFCDGFFVGNGVVCRDAKPCAIDVKCGSHSTCMVDPLFPKNPICKCEVGYKKTKKGKCVECLNNTDCNQVQATCYNGICKCKDELIKDEKMCKPAPLHACKADIDCDARAKCLDRKCICQGNTTGNGKYCRVSLECSHQHQCGSHGTCQLDPLLPNEPKCKCELGYSYAKDGKCIECLHNKHCASYSTCVDGVCKCKDELIKDEKTCKPAPLQLCDEDHKCHKKADCFHGKCYCKGNLTGNGLFCRDSLSCPDYFQCTNNSVCVVDPLIPKTPTCKCLLGFKMSPDGKCEEISQCLKRGLLCPNGTICVKSANDTFDCVCKEGLKMVGGPQDFTCKEVTSENCNCTQNAICENGECKCTRGFLMDKKGHCNPGPVARFSFHRHEGSQLSGSPSVTSHVTFLLNVALCHLALIS
ncbi:tenascin-like [Acropora millepora]|uniref:tenascin-like n=1 Tax=Acropora millepora TaxID=45264 RepID=UPI001CF40C6C|nr:tenascin-like [Acropora millepora]